jgi:hypothetical protein
MNLRLPAFAIFTCLLGNTLQGQSALVTQTIKSGALAEKLTSYCSEKNTRGAQQYQMQLDEWKQRNYWTAIQAKGAPGEYAQAQAQAAKAISGLGFRARILCLDVKSALNTPTFDPSKQHAQELAALAASAGGGAPQASGSTAAASGATQQQPAATAGGTQNQQTAIVTGGRTQVGDASFAVPSNWKPGKATANEALFQRPNKYNDVQIFAFQQIPMQGDLKSFFPGAVRRLFPGVPPKLEHIYPAVTRTGLPAFYVRDGSRLNGRNKSAALRAVGVGLPNNQLLLVMLISTDSYASLNDAEKELTAAVSSLTVRTQSGAATWNPQTNGGNGKASGLYWYNTLTVMPNAFGGMDTRAVRNYVVLLPDGHAYAELPEDGHVLDMNFGAACQKHPDECGSYSVQGSTIQFRWPDDFGLTQETSGAWAPGRSLETKGQKYSAIAPVRDLKIDGRYRSFFASVGSNAGGSTAVSSEKFITFTRDGRYQKQGFSGATFTNSNAAGTFGSKRGVDAGTYRIDGYTMLLKSQTTGQTESFSIVVDEEGAAKPKALFINDDAYLP